jgi:CubicO group peptidase (beta-lactamase class C family)
VASPDTPVVSSRSFQEARRILQTAIEKRAFPAAVIEVGRRSDVLWREAFGRLSVDDSAPACSVETIFDLASLTKVIVAATLAMRRVEDGSLTLETRVADRVRAWRGEWRESVTIRHLLDHSSGLPAHRDLWRSAAGRAAFAQAICVTPLERAPGSASVYSDLGFILLGFILEDAGQLLDETARAVEAHTGSVLRYTPDASLVPRIAPTEMDAWRGRLLQGEVHDENAAALGGVAAHAGLFGTISSVGAFARAVIETFIHATWLGSPTTMSTFAERSRVPGSSRALAWDTMLPTSSCGTLLSERAIGHTGFTGTSLWIDREGDLYVVLLTNRVHPTRANDAHLVIRPRVHDAIVREIGA